MKADYLLKIKPAPLSLGSSSGRSPGMVKLSTLECHGASVGRDLPPDYDLGLGALLEEQGWGLTQ